MQALSESACKEFSVTALTVKRDYPVEGRNLPQSALHEGRFPACLRESPVHAINGEQVF